MIWLLLLQTLLLLPPQHQATLRAPLQPQAQVSRPASQFEAAALGLPVAHARCGTPWLGDTGDQQNCSRSGNSCVCLTLLVPTALF